MKPVMLKFMFVKMRKTNGEPYTGRLVRTVRGQALGNLPSQDDKAPSAEPTALNDRMFCLIKRGILCETLCPLW